ncbi:hypothetical protein BC829DRAFT_133686 [Chytridium lagenaria]|nr:hypothetical protein BC829DRAFT_133686 [Chytridium lagenaria]
MKSMGQLVGGGAGVCDPRRVAAKLGAAGFEVWMDVRRRDVRRIARGERRVERLKRRLEERRGVVEEVGHEDDDADTEKNRDETLLDSPTSPSDVSLSESDSDDEELADALTLGMDHADCMIPFISDEFASSPQLSREFHFAHNVLRLPLFPSSF